MVTIPNADGEPESRALDPGTAPAHVGKKDPVLTREGSAQLKGTQGFGGQGSRGEEQGTREQGAFLSLGSRPGVPACDALRTRQQAAPCTPWSLPRSETPFLALPSSNWSLSVSWSQQVCTKRIDFSDCVVLWVSYLRLVSTCSNFMNTLSDFGSSLLTFLSLVS